MTSCQNHQFKKYEDTLPSIWATKNLVGIVISVKI
jgi:hypothetical protein